MATKNRRVAAYLPDSIDEKLQDFKVKQGLPVSADKPNQSDSQALIVILKEFFGVAQEVSHAPGQQEVIFQRLQTLEESIEKGLAVVKDDLNTLGGVVAHEIKVLTDRVDSLEQPSVKEPEQPESQQQSEPESESKSEPQSEQDAEILSQSAVVENEETLTNKVEGESSKEHVVDVVEGQGKTTTDTTLSTTTTESSNTQKPESQAIGDDVVFSLKELAGRFEIDKSNISHAKSKKSPEEFEKWLRDKDPDDKAWVWMPDKKKYRLMKDSESKLTLQPSILPSSQEEKG